MNPRAHFKFIAPAFIALAALAAYSNCFIVPFHYDDWGSIPRNPTILNLWNLADVLSPPKTGDTVAGRPLLNLSFAVNYAIDDFNVRGYHAVNLLIHILAGLTLYGLLRRTFLRPVLRERFGEAAAPLAFCIALMWTLHPLQTQAVTYIVQRAESMVSLFYLLTLYCFARALDSPAPRRWFALSFSACLLGTASKEIIMTAPIVVLLYDRTFGAGTFRGAWRERGRAHAALCSTWLMLAVFILRAGTREDTIGFNSHLTVWNYVKIQCWAIPQYLRLSAWPDPLVFDYGENTLYSAGYVLPRAMLILALLGLTIFALVRKPVLGFAGAFFFLVLGPTSSFVPVVSEPIAEHRMYLVLASVVSILVAGSYSLLGRRALPALFVLCLCAAAALGVATHMRNDIYRDAFTLYSDTVAKAPDNGRIQADVANALVLMKKYDEAMPHLEKVLSIFPQDKNVMYNIGKCYLETGRIPAAIPYLENAVAIDPRFPEAQCNLGHAYSETGRFEEAIDRFEKTLSIDPNFHEALNDLGVVYFKQGRLQDAAVSIKNALTVRPDYGDAAINLCSVLVKMGRPEETPPYFEIALKGDPKSEITHYNYGIVLAALGRFGEARNQFEEALRLMPDYPAAKEKLGMVTSEIEKRGVK